MSTEAVLDIVIVLMSLIMVAQAFTSRALRRRIDEVNAQAAKDKAA
jgi:hypothetical protein